MIPGPGADMTKKRARIIYSGRVQGVGFRWTAERAALACGVTGWVRNLPDGSVETVAEAEENDILCYMNNIVKHLSGNIHNVEVQWEDFIGEFDTFSVRYS
jgi:acylphosphatase